MVANSRYTIPIEFFVRITARARPVYEFDCRGFRRILIEVVPTQEMNEEVDLYFAQKKNCVTHR